MSQETDSERIPLLRNPFHSIQNYNNDNNNNSSSFIKLLGYGFIIVITLLISINLIFYFIESNEVVLPKGISEIPYEYYLRFKSENWPGSDFEYVIETSPRVDPKFSNLLINEDSNSSINEESTNDRLILGEIVTRKYKVWSPAYYEVRENKYSPSNNYTVLTTQSHMSGLWFIVWPPKVHISFASNDNVKDGDKKDERKTKIVKYDDLENLLKCDYEISWTYKYFGQIYRKCPDQEKWKEIAYVKGSSEWGMQWLDLERTDTYGIVTKPAPGRNRQMRNVVIRPDSPFPPILPALYVAYYDRVINRGDSEGRTHLLV